MRASLVGTVAARGSRLEIRRGLGVLVTTVAVLLAFVPPAASGNHRGRSKASCKKGRWCSLRSGQHPFEAWTLGTSNATADASALRAAVSLLDSLWGPETNLMGQPLPDVPKGSGGQQGQDSGNDSSMLDVYVVQPSQVVRREGRKRTIGADLAAEVTTGTSAAHHPPHGRSGFLLVGRNRLSSTGFKSDLAHEFFHALQDAHNATTSNSCPHDRFWFDEASATWAESYFVPRTAPEEVYDRFATFQAGTTWGLEDENDSDHPYASFIWPYFMQQQAGADSVAGVYKDAESASDCQALMNAVDNQVSFASSFRKFALRNLDDSATFDTGDLSPITPRYQELHADFPDSEQPEINEGSLEPQTGDAPPISESLKVPVLRAWYYHFEVDPNVGQVVVDGSKLSPDGGFDLDAVKNVNGSWQVQHLGAGKTTICTSPDSVTDIYLVVSNHDYDPKNTLTGQLQISPLFTSCGCPDYTKVSAFNGTASFSFDGSASATYPGGDHESISLHHSASGLALSAPLNSSDVGNAAFDGPISSGTVSVNQVDDYVPSSGDPSHTTAQGSGAPDPTNSQVSVTFDPAACTYLLAVSGAVATIQAGDGPPPDDGGINDTATSPYLPVPAGLSLSGSVTIQVYAAGPTDTTGIKAGYYSFGPFSSWGGELAQVKGAAADQPMGTATFTWNLTPTLRPSSSHSRRAGADREHRGVLAAPKKIRSRPGSSGSERYA